MDQNDYSRREFLKRFAALSSASLLLGMTGCAEYGPSPVAAYGPGPAGDPRVTRIYSIDVNANRVVLADNQSVPIDSAFEIQFSTRMDTTAPLTVVLHDDTNNNAVALDLPVWGNDYSASVTPSAVLLNNTAYTLSVTDATSAAGKKLVIDSNAAASFKTS